MPGHVELRSEEFLCRWLECLFPNPPAFHEVTLPPLLRMNTVWLTNNGTLIQLEAESFFNPLKTWGGSSPFCCLNTSTWGIIWYDIFVYSHKTQLCTIKYVYYIYYNDMFRPSTAIIRLYMKTSNIYIYTLDHRSSVWLGWVGGYLRDFVWG